MATHPHWHSPNRISACALNHGVEEKESHVPSVINHYSRVTPDASLVLIDVSDSESEQEQRETCECIVGVEKSQGANSSSHFNRHHSETTVAVAEIQAGNSGFPLSSRPSQTNRIEGLEGGGTEAHSVASSDPNAIDLLAVVEGWEESIPVVAVDIVSEQFITIPPHLACQTSIPWDQVLGPNWNDDRNSQDGALHCRTPTLPSRFCKRKRKRGRPRVGKAKTAKGLWKKSTSNTVEQMSQDSDDMSTNNQSEEYDEPTIESDPEEESRADPDDGETEDLVILDPNAVEVDLNHRRIAKIENLESLTCVETLCLRWNLIKKIENLHTLTMLKELELYDNQITVIENLTALVNLEVLDISFNRIRKIENLEGLTKLKKLFLCANKISRIENLNHLKSLELLELGDNKIRVIENLDGMTNLKSIFLGKNKITKLQNLDSLINLEILGVQSNRITKLDGLGRLVNLEQLYCSHNGIEVLEGLDNNAKLQTLDMAVNRIKKIENVSHLTDLEEFWFNGNQISDWGDLAQLENSKGLQTVYLEGNPLQRDPNYRRKIKLALPSLTQIDATLCR